jgi:hypothetical protein
VWPPHEGEKQFNFTLRAYIACIGIVQPRPTRLSPALRASQNHCEAITSKKVTSPSLPSYLAILAILVLRGSPAASVPAIASGLPCGGTQAGGLTPELGQSCCRAFIASKVKLQNIVPSAIFLHPGSLRIGRTDPPAHLNPPRCPFAFFIQLLGLPPARSYGLQDRTSVVNLIIHVTAGHSSNAL